MNYTNYHTHSYFCDGKGVPSDYIEEASRKGFFNVIGFSSHVPLPFECEWSMDAKNLISYMDTIKKMKRFYAETIKVYLSIEMDYLKGRVIPAYNPEILNELDYLIGAVHCLKLPGKDEYLNVDGGSEKYRRILEEGFHGSVRDMVICYYETVRDMIREYRPDFIAHLDLIKKNNAGGKYFSEKEHWYREEVQKTLAAALEYKAAVELNTGGMARAGMVEYYPSKWILMECKSLGIPVVLNSDAHKPEQLDAYFDIAIHDLKEIGYSCTDSSPVQWWL